MTQEANQNNNLVLNRSEILFLYDVTDANPNGDPNDENKPRIDEETGINIVTDVRLKRTIRDYLNELKGEEIFVRETEYGEGYIKDAKMRAEDFMSEEFLKEIEKKNFEEQKSEIAKNILKQCIDIRLFGATIPLDLKVGSGKDKKSITGSITLTGAVQFKIGRSLHYVEMAYIKGTGAFASGKEKRQATFREEYILPYSLIAFHGIINENAAKHTKMTEDDKNLLLEAIWMGTGNLISRSKFGQMPRLLVVVDYSDKNFFIGDLNQKVEIKSEILDKQIRSIKDIELNVTDLVKTLESKNEKIAKIHYLIDEGMRFVCDGSDKTDFKEIFSSNGLKDKIVEIESWKEKTSV